MAIKRWIGNATAVTDVWTFTLSGTVASQTYSVTIAGKSVSYAAGVGDDVSSILFAIQALWNASKVPEHAELTATATPSGGPYTSLTLTGKTPGKPHAITVGTTGGATFSIANTTPATGPNHFDNPLNWSSGSAPANSDTLVFDYGSAPCKYALNTTLTGIILQWEQGYSGQIGLPLNNVDNSTAPYQEYRTTDLTLVGGTAVINSPNARRCNLGFGANLATVRVLETGGRLDNAPPVLITGGNASSTLDISKGDVGLAYYQGTTAQFLSVKSSYVSNPLNDVTLTCGAGAVIGTLNKNAGSLTLRGDVTTLIQGIAGGNTVVADSADVANLDIQGGTVVYNSIGTLGSPSVANSGVLDFNQDQRPKTVTNPIQIYGDSAKVMDDMKTVNSGTLSVKLNKTSKINVSHGSDNTISLV